MIETEFPKAVDADESRLLRIVADRIDDLSPLESSSVFDPLPASADAPLANGFDDETSDPRLARTRALTVARYLIGAPEIPHLTLVLPEGAIPPGGLYLAHLRALLLAPGPVAVVVRDGLVRFTTPHGNAITLPVADREAVARARHFQLLAVPSVEGFPVFNSIPEIARAAAPFGLCQTPEFPEALSRITAGMAALRNIWPAAAGTLLQTSQGSGGPCKTQPLTEPQPEVVQGSVLISPEDPITVGDLLVHELSHIRLNLFREFDPLFEDREPELRHVSPWRQDPRPLAGLVLGVHAFLNVCHYYRRVSQLDGYADAAGALFERQREKVRAGWATARPFLLPTPVGTEFFEELEREVTAL